MQRSARRPTGRRPIVTAADSLLTAETWVIIARSLALSGREAEIARLILHDDSEQAIADHLGISSHTVHTHMERLFRKLNVSSRCQVVVRIFQAYLRLTAGSRGPARELRDARASLSPSPGLPGRRRR